MQSRTCAVSGHPSCAASVMCVESISGRSAIEPVFAYFRRDDVQTSYCRYRSEEGPGERHETENACIGQVRYDVSQRGETHSRPEKESSRPASVKTSPGADDESNHKLGEQ